MDENIALSLIHEDGEDQYISTRRPASQLASLLTKKLEKNTASWDVKSRKRFNIKLRRFGARNPEALASSRSLAHTSERLVLLSHIKSHIPRLQKWNQAEAKEEDFVTRIETPEEEPEAVEVARPTDIAVLHHGEFQKMFGLGPVGTTRISWHSEVQAVYDEALARLKEFLREVLLGVEHSTLVKKRLHSHRFDLGRLVTPTAESIRRFLEEGGPAPIAEVEGEEEETEMEQSYIVESDGGEDDGDSE